MDENIEDHKYLFNKKSVSSVSKQDCSRFQSILLSAIREKLNLMMIEVCQLCEQKIDIDFDNKEQLTQLVLEKIATNCIQSVHISSEEAQSYLNVIDKMEAHKEAFCIFKEEYNDKLQEEQEDEYEDNPYLESPFS